MGAQTMQEPSICDTRLQNLLRIYDAMIRKWPHIRGFKDRITMQVDHQERSNPAILVRNINTAGIKVMKSVYRMMYLFFVCHILFSLAIRAGAHIYGSRSTV